MKWAYNLQQKFKIALLLSVVFISLFIKNMIDKHNITTLGETFSSVYEDRLLAESYIYKFSAHLYQKKILINECASNADIAQYKSMLKFHDNAIEKLIQDFGQTKLTQEEALVFSKFKKTLKVAEYKIKPQHHKKQTINQQRTKKLVRYKRNSSPTLMIHKRA